MLPLKYKQIKVHHTKDVTGGEAIIKYCVHEILE